MIRLGVFGRMATWRGLPHGGFGLWTVVRRPLVGFCGGMLLASALPLGAQIDPVRRQLIQAGYTQPMEGASPLAGYAFFYWNQPGLIRSNLTLRLAVAPVYLDAELGIKDVLGAHTDLGLGVAGGGFADSYSEMRQGHYIRRESFYGHGVEGSISLYHLFNPEQRIPLNAIIRGSVHQSYYAADRRTDPGFAVIQNHEAFTLKSGLRWGGKEPVLTPDAALELSAWYEGQFREQTRPYGYNGDRKLASDCHLFWGRALFAYTFEKKQHITLNITSGTVINPDRFSAYRLGGYLPFTSEFPLSLPGYYYQELSARNFVVAGITGLLPISSNHRWSLVCTLDTALVDYLPGLTQPGHWHSGVGGGLAYASRSQAWQVILGYGYGVNALRDSGKGAHSIGILAQFDLLKAKQRMMDPGSQPTRSRGFSEFLRRIF